MGTFRANRLAKALAGVCALWIFVTPASAQANKAPRWKTNVGGVETFLPSTETRNITAVSTSAVTLAAPGIPLTLENPAGKCSATGKIRGSGAGEPGLNEEVKLKCEEVKVLQAPENCIARSPGVAAGTPTVETNLLSSKLVWLASAGTETGDLFKPATGTEFVRIILENKGAKTCPIANAKGLPVTGEVIGKVSPVESFVTEGTLEFPSPAYTKYWNNLESRTEVAIAPLQLNAQPATFTGTFKVNFLLAAGETGGIFPG
jgi:hypothetical protein